jgi:hypothetical protein
MGISRKRMVHIRNLAVRRKADESFGNDPFSGLSRAVKTWFHDGVFEVDWAKGVGEQRRRRFLDEWNHRPTWVGATELGFSIIVNNYLPWTLGTLKM